MALKRVLKPWGPLWVQSRQYLHGWERVITKKVFYSEPLQLWEHAVWKPKPRNESSSYTKYKSKHTITSHRNLGHPSPPKVKSHGGGLHHSSKISICFSLQTAEDCFFPFFLVLGFLSDSFNKILSPYFLTMLKRESSIGMVFLHDDHETTSSKVAFLWGNSDVVARTISTASKNLLLRSLWQISGFSRICFNPQSTFEKRCSVALQKEFPAIDSWRNS